ncbi:MULTISPECIES: universal stress protein [unclassified Haladaptatus]|uniref:universal stress protein n=1 Tax=unclassified Haladaptatus TaxID=2622732 RepID=UPI00209BF250|nr:MULTISPECIES: universal stress protein [unclassified Haladaptatus]MCO8246673.1 universal stress protein [Haladaptatus sp. AB643]MCO8256321.1 universal stress protein [Haladaptatus sp. AB618]
MERGVVAIDTTDTHRDLLREAGTYAAASDAELVVLAFLDESEYEADVETLESVGEVENVNYDTGAVTEAAANEATEFAAEVLDGMDVDFRTVVAVVDDKERGTRVIEAGEKYDCDHAFVVGKSRSPTGKALFGDFAQRVVLNFDGYVTLTMG